MTHGSVSLPCDNFILLINKNYTTKFNGLALWFLFALKCIAKPFKTEMKSTDLAMFCNLFLQTSSRFCSDKKSTKMMFPSETAIKSSQIK